MVYSKHTTNSYQMNKQRLKNLKFVVQTSQSLADSFLREKWEDWPIDFFSSKTI